MPACMPSRRSFSISVRYLPVVRQESHCLSSSFKLRAYSSRASRSSLDALKSVNWQCHLVVANPHYTRDRLAGVGVEEVTVISNQSSGRNSARVSVPHGFPSASKKRLHRQCATSTRREGAVAALRWWKAPLKKLSCGWPLSGIYEEDGLSSKNGHLHITPETAPRRINSLAEMAGGRIHIGNIYRRHLGA